MAKPTSSGRSKKQRPRQPNPSKRPPKREGFVQVFEQIYRLVLKIPRGRVMTYGQIALLLEGRYSARLVGWAMHATPPDERNIPWHRVINSRGSTSTGRVILHEPELQRLLLEAEGVIFNERGVCNLAQYQWTPPKKKAASSSAPSRPRRPKRQ